MTFKGKKENGSGYDIIYVVLSLRPSYVSRRRRTVGETYRRNEQNA
jgi:hypothetical protein